MTERANGTAPPLAAQVAPAPSLEERQIIRAILACFFLSGATGLAYEVIWTRMLGLVFGHTVNPVSAVPTTFMGGLAIGSALLAPLAPRTLNMGDRYLFVPSLGMCWLLSLGGVRVWDLAETRSRRSAIALGVAVWGMLLAWVGSSLTYASIWEDNITLFRRATHDFPGSAFGYNNLGLALIRAGRIEEETRALEAAVRLDPADLRAQLSVARTYVEHGRSVDGFRILDHLEPLVGRRKVYLLVRARSHMAAGERDAAQRVLRRAVERFPELAEAYDGLGYVLESLGEPRAALDAYRQAVALRPDVVLAHIGLARIQLHLGEPGKAMMADRTALALAQGDPAAAQILTEAHDRIRNAQDVLPRRHP